MNFLVALITIYCMISVALVVYVAETMYDWKWSKKTRAKFWLFLPLLFPFLPLVSLCVAVFNLFRDAFGSEK